MAITVQGPTGVFQPSYPDIIDKYGVVTNMFTSSFKEYFTSSGAVSYSVNKSLRFRSSASAYLNRTFAAGNQSTWTWSAWVKRGVLGTYPQMFSAGAGTGGSPELTIVFEADALRIDSYNGSTTVFDVKTTALYRDPAAWYHVVVAFDTTQATAADRVKFYINGQQITSLATASYPGQNTTHQINAATSHQISGSTRVAAYYYDGEMAEVNFVDGYPTGVTSGTWAATNVSTIFGAFSTYNQWLPKAYTGTYGTNGFYLPFTNTASTSTLVADSSGNANNWTPNNISLTAGSTYDSLTDVPTLTSTTVANYATWNPLKLQGNAATDGNLKATMTAGGPPYVAGYGVRSTVGIPLSGKWYAEIIPVTADAADGIGITDINTWNTDVNTIGNNTVYYRQTGTKYVNGVNNVAYGLSYSASDVIGVAVDITGGTVTFYKNNASQGAITLPSSTATYCFLVTNGNATAASFTANFGQQPFVYTPPSGFLPLNTFNI